MGKLKQKMGQDLKLRGLCENTRSTYLRCAQLFVRHYRRPPSQLGKTEIREYLLQMLDDRKWKPATYNIHAASLKFLYSNTLQRPEEVVWIGRMRVPYHPPAILSAEELERLLDALGTVKMQAIVMAGETAGIWGVVVPLISSNFRCFLAGSGRLCLVRFPAPLRLETRLSLCLLRAETKFRSEPAAAGIGC